MASVNAKTNNIVAHMVGVKAAVKQQADVMFAKMSAQLAEHQSSAHDHRIFKAKVGGADYIVGLEGPAAMSVEYGHLAYRGKRRLNTLPVAGTRIVRNGAGL